MGILQKKCRTTAKKALAYRGKGGQNTGTAFLTLGLRVVLYLPMDSVLEASNFGNAFIKLFSDT